MCTSIASKPPHVADESQNAKSSASRLKQALLGASLSSRGLLPALSGRMARPPRALGGPNGDSEAHVLLPPKLLAEIDTDDPAMMQKLVEETLYSQTSGNAGNFHEITRSLDATSGFNELEKLDRRAFSNDVDRLRKRMVESRRGFINPRSSYMNIWDLVTATALIYTATVTPFEVGLGLETKIDALFFVNQVINVIFMIDICIQFFLPVPDHSGELIRNRKVIAKKYLCSWFAIDVVSVLPFDYVTIGSDTTSGGPGLRSFRLFRILRLAKLVRMLRASRIIQRWQNAIDLSSSEMSLLEILLAYSIFVHWFACLWAMLPQVYGNLRNVPGFEMALRSRLDNATSWGETCTGCLRNVEGVVPAALSCQRPNTCLTECEVYALADATGDTLIYVRNQEHWMCRALYKGLLPEDFDNQPFLVWTIAMENSVLQFAGSVGAIGPTNACEFVYYLVSLTIGLLIFSAVQAVFVRMFTTSDPDETYYSQSLDALNFMMRDTRMPKDIRQRVRDYFRKSKKMLKRMSYDSLIDRCLSHELRGDARYQISHDVFKQVWWLAECERSFLEELSIFIKREGFEAKSIIHSKDELTILVQGVCSRAGTIITAGTAGGSWGDVILTASKLRDTRTARALTYCEIATLTHDDLFNTAANFPVSLKIIREAALRLATWRAVMIISAFTRLLKTKRYGKGGEPPEGVDEVIGGLGNKALLKSLHSEVFSKQNEQIAAKKNLADLGEMPAYREIEDLDPDDDGTSPSAQRKPSSALGASAAAVPTEGGLIAELRDMRLELLREQGLMRERMARIEAALGVSAPISLKPEVFKSPSLPPSREPPSRLTHPNGASSARGSPGDTHLIA